MGNLGLCPARLARIDARFEADVKRAAIPGAVVLVARHGEVAYRKAFGFRDPAGASPMAVDSIFWLASMTKPIIATAAMVLAEESRLHLGDPVLAYLPEFRDLKVRTIADAPGEGAPWVDVPCEREMTVQDLLRHTSGLSYGFLGESPVNQAYASAGVYDFGKTNQQMACALAALPLACQPGSSFEYGMSTDVLGRIIEVVAGQPLDEFIAERITGPLRLRDTGFCVPPAQHPRVARPLATESFALAPAPFPPPVWKSGGGGLWSSADDYGRFAQMLLNGGELEGVRVLSPRTVAHMTCNHLPPGVRYGSYVAAMGAVAPTPDMGQGFGLGVAVRTEAGRNPLPGSVGDFWWPGISGACFWVDPAEDLVAVLMLQAPSRRVEYRAVLRQLVYQALVD